MDIRLGTELVMRGEEAQYRIGEIPDWSRLKDL